MLIHANNDAGITSVAWPDIIPKAYRKTLRSRTGLRKKLRNYSLALAALTLAEKRQVKSCLKKQNQISKLCRCADNCESLDQLPPSIHDAIVKLFDFAFDLLTELQVRDRHYLAIYNSTMYHVCPFCGCEFFDAPGAPREDLDHFLPKCSYPFAAVNLRNLVPMGMKCNEKYKRAKDILHNANGTRRPVFDPYVDRKIAISLANSVPFKGTDGLLPKWKIEFTPMSPECTTWDNVFHLRERTMRDVLNPEFKSWLSSFHAWSKSCKITAHDDATVIDAVGRYAEYLSDLSYNDRALFKAAVFKMILTHCKAGNARLLNLMRDFLIMGRVVKRRPVKASTGVTRFHHTP